MWQRLSLYDARVIGHYLGDLIAFSSIALILPFVTALICGEWEAARRYFFAIGLTLVFGAGLRFLRLRPGRLNRQQAMVVTGLAWVVLAFFASIPLYMSGHYSTFLDSLFDGVSGITTTGVSIISDLDHLSYADNMWRFTIHLLGGLGLVVVALSFGLFGRQAGATMYASEGRSEHVVPNVVQTTRFIAKVAMLFICIATAIVSVLCFIMGMEPARAFLHGLWMSASAFATGGFAPMSNSVFYYHSFAIEVVLMLLMIVGSVNFTLHPEVWKGKLEELFGDLEIRTMVLWLLVMTFVFAASLSASAEFSSLPAMLRRGLFMVVSAFSTTGFQNVTSNQMTTAFSSGAFLALAVLMAVGGSAGSTAGGIKFMRVGIILKSIVSTIKETLAPDSARVVVSYNHVGRHVINHDIVKEAMTVFVLYVVTYAIGALVGIAHGYDATQAVFESVAMASNGGLSAGISVAGMPLSLELFYMLEMWAGRLEFVTLLALLVEVVVSLNPMRFIRRNA